MSASTLEIGIILFSAEGRSGLPSALGGSVAGKFQPMTAKWNSNWVDSVQNLPYTFTYNGQTYTDNTSIVTTDKGFFTIEPGGDTLELTINMGELYT
jgi:hypothetical protein